MTNRNEEHSNVYYALVRIVSNQFKMEVVNFFENACFVFELKLDTYAMPTSYPYYT